MKFEIKNYEFKSGLDYEIELISLNKLTNKNSHFLSLPHRTNFYHIFIFHNCTPTHIVDFVPIKIKPYSLLFIDKDRVHHFDLRSKYDGKVLIFTENFFCSNEEDIRFIQSTRLFNELTDNPFFELKNQFNKFSDICNCIEKEVKSPNDYAKPQILKNHLYNFLLLAEREKNTQVFYEIKKSSEIDYTLKLKQLINKNFRKIKSVDEYSEMLNISEKKLNLATSKVLGKSPKELINERVLLEAKRMMAHGNQSIKEIGYELGFEDPTYFIKYFKKSEGMTPVEFRKNISFPKNTF